MRNHLLLNFLILSIALIPVSQSSAQSHDSNLRQGRVLSEADAELRMSGMAANIPDAAAWTSRAERIRQNILRGAKLGTLPPPCPLNPIRHSKRELNGYSVENVAFEALPGFFVTGNLYLPIKFEGRIPGVLAPHGHRENKRRFESTQYRCAAMAKMGAVVFAWDMLGYGESQPCQHKHPQALRLQTYSSLRVVDFLLSLDIVNEQRIAITGASGGGTQSFVLSAIDPRIAVSAPVVQVSAHFYGGCVCESGMPVHVHGDFETNNVEFAASFAPKPLLLVSNGEDWTKNTPRVEFPYVQRIYRFFDAEQNVENAHFPDEGHDYGPSKRMAVYRFFAKHLGLDLDQVINSATEMDESFVKVLSLEELAVFDDANPRPAHSAKSCSELLELLDGE